MSIPSRSSPSMRHPSQSNLQIPLPNLPQYPPAHYPPPPARTQSYPHGVPMSEMRYGHPFGMNDNGNENNSTSHSDGNRYFRVPLREEERPSHYHPSQPASTSAINNGRPSEPRSQTKKRPRQSSASQNPSHSQSPPSPKLENPPSVLVREKKQKACANCRRAKLKCIVEKGSDCVRCESRKEKCIFYPRSHVCPQFPFIFVQYRLIWCRMKTGSKPLRRTCTPGSVTYPI